MKEVPGAAANPLILKMLQLDQKWPKDDSVPWCGGFLNYICWLGRWPRSKSLMARSWLSIGTPIPLAQAKIGYDVVILKRGGAGQPGPTVLNAPGHVGLFAGLEGSTVHLLAGNQNDSVNVSAFKAANVLGVRRLG